MRRIGWIFLAALSLIAMTTGAMALQGPRGAGGQGPRGAGAPGAPGVRGGAPPGGGRGGGAQREIVNIKGDLYRARNANYYSIFLVTPEGIILADPINEQFATWMKEQFAERFKVPVRYVIYSHSHWDHVEGGAVFADTARFIAHENMLRNMDGRIPQMPGDMLDRNNDGAFELNEIVEPMTSNQNRCGMPGFFHQTHDRNGDGRMTPTEMMADIRRPDLVYSDRMKISLGGKTIELIYPGRNHSDDATVIYFPDERVVFATEFIADVAIQQTGDPKAFPSACGPFDGNPLSEWIKSYRTVEALDFDVFAGGHAALGTKADVTAYRQFFEDLVRDVSTGMAQGKSLAELQQTLTMDKYKSWAGYAQRRAPTIESAYNNLKTYRY
ncbi:MAG TPA: MBL fold metallo-hydrolase [Terriglobia bacterium]|nr:MBL fold metallo-hydrolase [Terriglobia bacterium]